MDIYKYNTEDYDYYNDADLIEYAESYGYYKRKPPCHTITEIYKNFFLCNAHQIIDAMERGMKFDVLVPLAVLSASVWHYTKPTETQVFYFPCPDFDTIPNDLLDFLVSHVIDFIKQDKKVALFCEGGHGRTGYIGSCVLGKLGVKNPVNEIRSRYCSKTVETISQMESIANFLRIDLDKEISEMKYEKYINNIISALVSFIRDEEKEINKKLKEGEKIIHYDTSWLYQCTDKELIELARSCSIIDQNGNIIYSRVYDTMFYGETETVSDK